MSSLSEPARRVATIYAPGDKPPYGPGFYAVAAAGDDRTFVAETDSARRIARFYEIRLDRSGKPGRLVRLRFALPDPTGQSPAIAPDGREIAAGFSFRKRSGIAVISAATGRIRRWAWSGPAPEYLAWSGNHRIDFVTSTGHGLRSLSTAPPGGNLGASRTLAGRLIRFAGVSSHSIWFIRQLVTTPDGRTAFVMVSSLSSIRASTGHFVVVSINAVSGAPHAMLTKTAFQAGGNDEVYCGVLWADGSGHHVLVSCGGPAAWPATPIAWTSSPTWRHTFPYPDIQFAWGE